MRHLLRFPLFLLIACGTPSKDSNDPVAESDADTDADADIDYVEASDVLPGFCSPGTSESGSSTAAAAQALIASYGRDGLVFEDVDAQERYTWTVLPTPVANRDGQGARTGDMTEAQIVLLCDLLDASLTDMGVGIAAGAMSSDEVLGEESDREDREYTKDNYWLAIFGDPGGSDAWAYQLEGHHLGINVAIKGDRLSVGPNLYGAYPLRDEGGVPVMDEQINAKLAFAASLTDAQREELVIGEVPSEVDVDSQDIDSVIMEPSSTGLSVGSLSTAQKELLWVVLDSYPDTLPLPQRTERRALVEGELDTAVVSWEGSTTTRPFGFGFRSSSLHLIFSGEDQAEHCHAIFRMPDIDYGADL